MTPAQPPEPAGMATASDGERIALAAARVRDRARAVLRRHDGDAIADAIVEDLVARHAEPHRRYHTIVHVDHVVADAQRLLDADDRGIAAAVVIAAALFHDAIYDARASDNEAASADLAANRLAELDWPAATIDEVRTLIGETADHRPTSAASEVLLDADLAILGADAAVYRRYVAAVRIEYAHVPDDAWRIGRAAVLRHLLDSAPLYRTPSMSTREPLARVNMLDELASLGG